MRRPWSWCASSAAALALVLALAALAGAPAAARVLEHRAAITVDAGGRVSERWQLEVSIENLDDVADWQAYPIYLDDNRRLVQLTAAVVGSDGRRQPVGKKEQDLVQAAGEGILHSSARFQVVRPPGLAPGATFELAYSLEGEPYWPGGILAAAPAAEAVDRVELTVMVDPAAGPLRYRLDGPATGLTLEGDAQRVAVRGSLARPEPPPELAGGGTVRHSVLRWSWGAEPSWEGLGGWYQQLLGGVPQGSPAVVALARRLTAGAKTPREKAEALVAHLRRKVRYVAVEVGIGGFRPHPPEEVAERQWGDCKDKSLLLVDLARAVGLEAWPALVRLGEDQRIDRNFPSPHQFNHEIVAFAAAALEPRPGDPVAGGFFVVDPTQEIGGAGYLHQAVQDQDALVVRDGKGALVRLPSLPETAGRRLEVELELAPDGGAKGRARLELTGDAAAGLQRFRDGAASQAPLEELLRGVFAGALRGARLSGLTYDAAAEEPLPKFVATVSVEHPSYLEGAGSGGSVQPGGLRQFPESRDLEKIAAMAAAAPGAGITEQRFSFHLPEGACLPEPRKEETANPLGLFRLEVRGEGREVVLERRAELRRPWVEKADYPALGELAIAEGRALQRRLRFTCKNGGG